MLSSDKNVETIAQLAEIVKPYVILERKGLKIGVFGLAPKLEGLVFEKNYGPLKYLNPSEVAQRMVDELKTKQKCDLVICISHLGWEITDFPDNRLIQETSGIDLVLGGHSHTYLQQLEWINDKNGHPVAVDQNGKHAAFVGKLSLTLK